jgi:hypothetical protein
MPGAEVTAAEVEAAEMQAAQGAVEAMAVVGDWPEQKSRPEPGLDADLGPVQPAEFGSSMYLS